MDINYARGLVTNYAQNQWEFINQAFGTGIRDARCVWLSLDDLKAYIQQVEQPNPLGVVTTGVRIYFGAYSQAYPAPGQEDYDCLHTLLMIPTFTGNDGLNYDFDATTGSSDFQNMNTVSAMNHGTLTPPPFTEVGPNNMYRQGDLFMAYADNYPTKNCK